MRPDATNDYAFDVIPAMTMCRSKVRGCEWSDGELDELIDQLMFPMLRPGTT